MVDFLVDLLFYYIIIVYMKSIDFCIIFETSYIYFKFLVSYSSYLVFIDL